MCWIRWEEGGHPSNVSSIHLQPPRGNSVSKSMSSGLALIISRARGDFCMPLYPWPLKDPWLNGYRGKVPRGLLPTATPQPSSLSSPLTADPRLLCQHRSFLLLHWRNAWPHSQNRVVLSQKRRRSLTLKVSWEWRASLREEEQILKPPFHRSNNPLAPIWLWVQWEWYNGLSLRFKWLCSRDRFLTTLIGSDEKWHPGECVNIFFFIFGSVLMLYFFSDVWWWALLFRT